MSQQDVVVPVPNKESDAPDSTDQPTKVTEPTETLPATEEVVKEAVATARADAVAIAELCQLAGQPQRIAAFLAEGASEAKVRRTLLAARAESVEITSTINPDAVATREASPEQNPLMKAVKKLSRKD